MRVYGSGGNQIANSTNTSPFFTFTLHSPIDTAQFVQTSFQAGEKVRASKPQKDRKVLQEDAQTTLAEAEQNEFRPEEESAQTSPQPELEPESPDRYIVPTQRSILLS